MQFFIIPYVSLLGLFLFFWGGGTLDPLGGWGWPDPLPAGLEKKSIRTDDDPLAQSSQRAFAIASACT